MKDLKPRFEWACDCKELNEVKGMGKMFPAEVNEDNICVKCGYYAVLLDTRILYENGRHPYKKGA